MTDPHNAARIELLLLQCRRGDQEALATLVSLWENRLLYYIRRIVPNEQEAFDALQKTWLRALPRLPSIRDPARLAPWLYRIARNTALNHARQTAAALRHLDNGAPVEDLPAGDPGDFTPEDAAAVHAALNRLELAHREILTLFFLRDLTLEQIARLIGIPTGTVKSRLHYAKRALRIELQPKEPSP